MAFIELDIFNPDPQGDMGFNIEIIVSINKNIYILWSLSTFKYLHIQTYIVHTCKYRAQPYAV